MKEKIENLLKEKRKTKIELANLLGITYPGLQNKLNQDTFKHSEIIKLESFFEVEKGYFDNGIKSIEEKPEQNMWELVKELYEKRNEELTAALADARYTIQLQRKMLEGKANFLNLSKRPPVKRVFMSGMYISQISLMRA